jgi:hypothetical protein
VAFIVARLLLLAVIPLIQSAIAAPCAACAAAKRWRGQGQSRLNNWQVRLAPANSVLIVAFLLLLKRSFAPRFFNPAAAQFARLPSRGSTLANCLTPRTVQFRARKRPLKQRLYFACAAFGSARPVFRNI